MDQRIVRAHQGRRAANTAWSVSAGDLDGVAWYWIAVAYMNLRLSGEIA